MTSRADVSRSMVALVVSASAALLLGLLGWVPPLLGRDVGIRDVSPGLFVSAPEIRGHVTLGEGLTVSVYESGIRIANQEDVMLDTVRSGSPFSAVAGYVEHSGRRREERISARYDNVRLETLELGKASATYRGVVFGPRGHYPLRVVVDRRGPVVRMFVTAEGADGVVLHLDDQYETEGYVPVLPEQQLRRKAWWFSRRAEANQPAFRTELGTSLAAGPYRASRAVDLRPSGRVDVHVWAGTVQFQVAPVKDPPVADS